MNRILSFKANLFQFIRLSESNKCVWVKRSVQDFLRNMVFWSFVFSLAVKLDILVINKLITGPFEINLDAPCILCWAFSYLHLDVMFLVCLSVFLSKSIIKEQIFLIFVCG